MVVLDVSLLKFGRGGMETHMDVRGTFGAKVSGALVLIAE